MDIAALLGSLAAPSLVAVSAHRAREHPGLLPGLRLTEPTAQGHLKRLRRCFLALVVPGPRQSVNSRSTMRVPWRSASASTSAGWPSGRASKRLTIEELEVTRLKVTELEVAGEKRPSL
jgi:hypothetical protein